ncbi:hypothetical protein QBC34DRAFT_378724 [Podospora aff. communis PSN243]|uniref:Uncharacterized protein n=1 Tax=Podospora aff. communis PSN243 TaxID=3040156 RepID=A0AAV9GU16_9PEZI|nr:hypothetical protein QBC34DRAFT_378724 [Podospora aff. communis PSN243]
MKTSVVLSTLLAAVAIAAPSQIERRTGDWDKCLGKCVRGCKGPVYVALACVAICEVTCGAALEDDGADTVVDFAEIFPEN